MICGKRQWVLKTSKKSVVLVEKSMGDQMICRGSEEDRFRDECAEYNIIAYTWLAVDKGLQAIGETRNPPHSDYEQTEPEWEPAKNQDASIFERLKRFQVWRPK
jgi:hypothetical protein